MSHSLRNVVSAITLIVPSVISAESKFKEVTLPPANHQSQNRITNQTLINELIGFVKLLSPDLSVKGQVLLADRICKSRLGIGIETLINSRTSFSSEKNQRIINDLISGNEKMDIYPKEPIIPYLTVLLGESSLKFGQTDVLRQIAPVVSKALSISTKVEIDSEFFNKLIEFQINNNLAISGEINQATVEKLIAIGKIHLEPEGLVLAKNEPAFIKIPFDMEPDEVIASPGTCSPEKSTAEEILFINQIREALSVNQGSGYDGNLELAIIKFRLENRMIHKLQGKITPDLILELNKKSLLPIYLLSEEPLTYSTMFPDGLIPSKPEDILEISDRLFSTDKNISRSTELILYSSGKYDDFLKELEKIYNSIGNSHGVEKVQLILKARKQGIDFPVRVICSDNGELDKLTLFLSSTINTNLPSNLILTPIADHNGVFQTTIVDLPQDISGNIIYDDIASFTELENLILKGTFCGHTQIELLISSAHGNTDGVTYGLDHNYSVKSPKGAKLTNSFDFSRYQDCFSDGAVIFFNSCLTADDKECPKNSFAYQVSKQLPNVFIVGYKESVYSPKFYIIKGFEKLSEKIQFLPENSRYIQLSRDRYLLITSARKEIPIILRDGKIQENILSKINKRFPEIFSFSTLDLFGNSLIDP